MTQSTMSPLAISIVLGRRPLTNRLRVVGLRAKIVASLPPPDLSVHPAANSFPVRG